MYSEFSHSLQGRLDALRLPAPVRAQIDAQRPRLAAAETADPRGREAIESAFVDGWRFVMWMGTALALASSATAALLIDGDNRLH
jgi:hypothetical protein